MAATVVSALVLLPEVFGLIAAASRARRPYLEFRK
jgi:hypothetical protein